MHFVCVRFGFILFAAHFTVYSLTAVIVNGPSNTAVVLGNDIHLACTTIANVMPKWNWIPFRNNSEIRQKIPNYGAMISRDDGHHELIIGNAQYNRTGRYFCYVDDYEGLVAVEQSYAFVNVMANMHCQNNYSKALGGRQVVRLTCSTSFTGRGVITLAWRHSNGSVSTHVNYTFDSYEPTRSLSLDIIVPASMSFNYTCTAKFQIDLRGNDVAGNVVQDFPGSSCSAVVSLDTEKPTNDSTHLSPRCNCTGVVPLDTERRTTTSTHMTTDSVVMAQSNNTAYVVAIIVLSVSFCILIVIFIIRRRATKKDLAEKTRLLSQCKEDLAEKTQLLSQCEMSLSQSKKDLATKVQLLLQLGVNTAAPEGYTSVVPIAACEVYTDPAASNVSRIPTATVQDQSNDNRTEGGDEEAVTTAASKELTSPVSVTDDGSDSANNADRYDFQEEYSTLLPSWQRNNGRKTL